MMFELILLPVLISGAAYLAHVCQKPPERLPLFASEPLQQSTQDKTPGTPDQAFMNSAANNGVYGLILGTLAIEKTQDPQIMSLAEKMVQANQRIILEITAMAERKGFGSTKSLDARQYQTVQQLSQMAGENFDRKFRSEADAEYRRKILIFEQEKNTGKDKEFQKFASDTMIRIKSRLKNQLAA